MTDITSMDGEIEGRMVGDEGETNLLCTFVLLFLATEHTHTNLKLFWPHFLSLLNPPPMHHAEWISCFRLKMSYTSST